MAMRPGQFGTKTWIAAMPQSTIRFGSRQTLATAISWRFGLQSFALRRCGPSVDSSTLRGRDHGLPGFDAMPLVLGLEPGPTGRTPSSWCSPGRVRRRCAWILATWNRGLAELHVKNGMLGGVFVAIESD